MRQRILFVMILFIVLVLAKEEVNNTLDNVALINIEALADNESKYIFCFGIGSIDCPVDHTKVYDIWY